METIILMDRSKGQSARSTYTPGVSPDFGPTARQMQALDAYPEMQEFVDNSRMSRNTTDKRATYLEIRTDNGIKGLYGSLCGVPHPAPGIGSILSRFRVSS